MGDVTTLDVHRIYLFPEAPYWGVNDQRFDVFASFEAALLQQMRVSPDAQVTVIGDKSVSMERFLQLLTFMQSRNIEAADIMMQHPG